MQTRQLFRFALLIGVITVAAGRPQAVIVRHDRTDAESLALGQRFAAVGRVLPDGGCTLIGPTWVVTAAHVALPLRPQSRVQFGDKTYGVKRVVPHPEGASAPRGTPPEVDLAVIELAEPVEGIEPLPLYRDRDELGKTAFIVGYGDFGIAGQPFQRMDGRRRAATNVIADAGPKRLFLNFDAPPQGTPLEGIGGPGDSGGPLLIEQAGRLYLAGVSSASMNGKPGTYGVTDVYTRVSSYATWIDARLTAAPGRRP